MRFRACFYTTLLTLPVWSRANQRILWVVLWWEQLRLFRKDRAMICKECEHYNVTAVQVKNKWRYRHKCLHPLAAGRECKFGQLGISKGFDIKRKTAPRWCPLKWGGRMTCKDCPRRTITCHITCPDYAAYQAERAELLQKKKQEYISNDQAVRRSIRKQAVGRAIERQRQGY